MSEEKKNIQPGDVVITKCELTSLSTGRKINFIGQVAMFNIYEDIDCSTMMASIEVMDGSNVLGLFPIIGEEMIEFEFRSTATEQLVNMKFHVVDVTNLSDANPQMQSYTIRAVSVEHVTNSLILVRKSYNNTIDNIVGDLLSQFIKTDKKVFIDPTKGTFPLCIPSLHPYEAIDFCKSRAVATKNDAPFVFFENQDGIHFRSVASIMQQGQTPVRIYTKGSGDLVKQVNKSLQRNILSYQHLVRSNSFQKIQWGVFANKVRTYDLITKEVKIIDFKVEDLDVEAPDKGAFPSFTDSFYNKNKGTPEILFVPTDTSRPSSFIPETLSARNAYAELLSENVIRLLVEGDSGLKVGMGIQVELPQVTQRVDQKGNTCQTEKEESVHGNYIIYRLCHMIAPAGAPTHKVSFDAIKIGFV